MLKMATETLQQDDREKRPEDHVVRWIPNNYLIATRFVLGWMFISAAFRRWFNAPSKLEYASKHNIGGKFSTMVPHAIWPLNHLMNTLILHPHTAFGFLIIFTWIEFLVGLFLITGTLTRLSALGAVLLSFGILWGDGWQGTTCVDEWQIGTVEGIAAMVFMFSGAGPWSLDRWLLRNWDGYVHIGPWRIRLA
ncbi:TQO small subunit DoxD [Sulfobacillus thermotolerans]|uniref:TQO small subunit DoxD n=1 Tax=Sulfobacillus thermotolerans TaxID=338644 RepID=A0ABN5GW69_9FIRM|nr:TQO small subunit DoxD [Sulfobacillus thermotolerans]